ncbi:MAG: response regulator transcription factor [Methylococcales bacterium]|nr:response regulator transcription factor [Methylococcales bacterium]
MIITIQVVGKVMYSFEDDGLRVIAHDNDLNAAVKSSESHQPNIILLDYDFLKTRSSLFIKSLYLFSAESKIIMLGSGLQENQLIDCLLAGIYGYLDEKDFEMFFVQAIKAVDSGEAWVSRCIVAKLIESIRG